MILNYDWERDLELEEFEIAADSQSIMLTASTTNGLDHAIHYFLEKAFGVRWLWPGEGGTVTPHATDVTWPVGITRYKRGFSVAEDVAERYMVGGKR